MPCLKPNGDCTTPENCGNTGAGDCGCGGGSGCGECGGGGCGEDTNDRYPCAGIQLSPDGDFTNATIAVRNGCIVAVTSGIPPVYTPDDCCAPADAPRMQMRGVAMFDAPQMDEPQIQEAPLPGRDGAAATIEFLPIVQGSGTRWGIENLGTRTAAIVQMTAPAMPAAGSAEPGSAAAFTGNIKGWEIKRGLVMQSPPDAARLVVEQKGTTAALYQAIAFPDGSAGAYKLALNLDGLVAAMERTANAAALRVAALEAELAQMAQRLLVLEGNSGA